MIQFISRVRRNIGEERCYLLLLSTFCISVLIVRMVYTGSITYRFMAINLILAWIPYLISRVIAGTLKENNIILKISLIFLWLLFFPNAVYMTTDILHLYEYPSVPLWYDLIMLLAFAWCGLLLGLHSLKHVNQRLFVDRNNFMSMLFCFSIFFLAGIGIYLGRYLRWNSWDLIIDPYRLIYEFADLMKNEFQLANMLSLALLFAIFLSILYFRAYNFKINNISNS